MGWVVRIAAAWAALPVAACAVIAGLEDPAAMELTASDGGSVQDTSSSSSGGGGSSGGDANASADGSGGADATSSSDARADGPPVDACALAKNGDFCTQASACCSGKCGERRECVGSCQGGGGFCTPGSTDECCFGFWCNIQCAACIASGQQAAQPGGFPLPQSCCSRSLKIASTECQ